jgi:UDP-N-acetylmuramoyl-tripeptide--D-alanyl-D-alanine ligase
MASFNHARMLWQGEEVRKAIQGSGATHWVATGVSVDTRTLQPGDLFLALPGPNWDGRAFIDQAWRAGAHAVITQDPSVQTNDPEKPILVVEDTFAALNRLAGAARARFQGKVLALTGSVGKTSVKDGLAHVLSAIGKTSASLNSLNNHIGVPLTLARLPADAEFAIFEVGMNHAGEIAELIQMILPHVALITQVSYQHGEFFSNLSEIVAAKSEIFSAPKPLVGILNQDSPHYAALHQQGQNVTQWITFSQHNPSTIRGHIVKKQDQGSLVHLSIKDQHWTYHWPLQGSHTIDNSLAIAAGAFALGAPMDAVIEQMSTIQASRGRGNQLTIGGIVIIDESYNAAPAAMQAVLTEFKYKKSLGKRYIVLGEMKELGSENHQCHANLIPYIENCGCDGVWLCGRSFEPFLNEITHLVEYNASIDALLPSITKLLQPGDCILIKGANSMRTFSVIGALQACHGQNQP